MRRGKGQARQALVNPARAAPVFISVIVYYLPWISHSRWELCLKEFWLPWIFRVLTEIFDCISGIPGIEEVVLLHVVDATSPQNWAGKPDPISRMQSCSWPRRKRLLASRF